MPAATQNPFGRLLRAAIRASGATQEDWASRHAVPLGTLVKWIHGTRAPAAEAVHDLLDLLAVPDAERETWLMAAAEQRVRIRAASCEYIDLIDQERQRLTERNAELTRHIATQEQLVAESHAAITAGEVAALANALRGWLDIQRTGVDLLRAHAHDAAVGTAQLAHTAAPDAAELRLAAMEGRLAALAQQLTGAPGTTTLVHCSHCGARATLLGALPAGDVTTTCATCRSVLLKDDRAPHGWRVLAGGHVGYQAQPAGAGASGLVPTPPARPAVPAKPSTTATHSPTTRK